MRFQDLIQELSLETFEDDCRRLVRRLDRNQEQVTCQFERLSSPKGGSRDNILAIYRREVSAIPRMDRAEELQFIMGIEFLWRRLKTARRAAGFSKEEVERYPGTDDLRCGTCPPGRQRVCMGCAPIEPTAEPVAARIKVQRLVQLTVVWSVIEGRPFLLSGEDAPPGNCSGIVTTNPRQLIVLSAIMRAAF